MNHYTEIADWAALLTAILVLIGAVLTLIGTIGMVRFKSFYQRIHAPTMGTTLGAGCILMASILFFSVAGSRPVIHELLLTFFMVVATPVTFLLLVRAVLYRDRVSGRKRIPGSNTEDSTTGSDED
jgi:multicomponent K+:H+ antiporter subunit G